jgi:hypothetical protein
MSRYYSDKKNKNIITSDILGSYTGIPEDWDLYPFPGAEEYAKPEQDADDL